MDYHDAGTLSELAPQKWEEFRNFDWVAYFDLFDISYINFGLFLNCYGALLIIGYVVTYCNLKCDLDTPHPPKKNYFFHCVQFAFQFI